jgi:hypothetical protein
MSTRTARNPHSAGPAHPEQLTLLATSDLPVQFRLDRRTRERGLEHIAEIRRLLASKHDAGEIAAPRIHHDQAA